MVFTSPFLDKKPELYLYEIRYGKNTKKAYEAHKRHTIIFYRPILSEQQNHRCCYCGIRTTEECNKSNSSSIEHIIPSSMGGENHPDNYVISCHRCNQFRGNENLEIFLLKLKIFPIDNYTKMEYQKLSNIPMFLVYHKLYMAGAVGIEPTS